MDCCHISRPFARRPFIVTAYALGDGGEFMPVMPLACMAEGAGSDGDPCRIWLHHRRPRKTGPGFPLTVVECRTHGVAFTLYPPGYVPYGRVAIAPVDPEGRLLHESTEHGALEVGGSVDDDSDAGPVARSLAWSSTLFRAAQDAAQGLPWPRVASGCDCWRTQGRWIVLGATILGLMSATEGSMTGDLLGVSALGQREAAAAYAAASGYRDRGQAVTLPLAELEQAGLLALDQILVAGFVAARWGPPRRWDSRSGRLRRLVPRARAP